LHGEIAGSVKLYVQSDTSGYWNNKM